MKEICEYQRCFGCGLCADICAFGAIEMRPDAEKGHLRPVIDSSVCSDCGRCQKLCPANREPVYHENIITYAAWRTNPNQQRGSSSGGVAAAFYETAIDLEMVVAGTQQNSRMTASMKVCDSLEEIKSFRGSKYVQADTRGVYRKLTEALKAGKKVLFIGTPCQCEAAGSAAGRMQDALLTVDLICHGVPSEHMLLDYIAWVGAVKGKKVDSLSFRSEWGVEMRMFSSGKKIWERRMHWDYFLHLFNYGYIVNEACFGCPYACQKRASDITIGDFWGIGKTVPFEDPKRKVSVIGVNTEKGKKFLSKCKTLTLVEREWSEAVEGNSQLRAPQEKAPDHDLFWNTYRQEGLDKALRATVYDKVSARYKKEYPMVFLKSKAKKLLGKS